MTHIKISQDEQGMKTRRCRGSSLKHWIGLMCILVLLALTLPARAEAAPAAEPGSTLVAGASRWDGPPGSDSAKFEPAPPDPASPANEIDWAPDGSVNPLTDKLYWVILALVLFGALILMADFPDDRIEAHGGNP